jgi:predicted nucleic acid-binding protein
LNRPFDDQSQDRIKLEAEAIIMILFRIEREEWIFTGSEVIDYEISQILDREKMQKVKALTSMAKDYIIVTEEVEERAVELEKIGFRPYDALHIACAERSGVDIFLTTDDKLLHKAKEVRLNVKVNSPVEWVLEVIANEY